MAGSRAQCLLGWHRLGVVVLACLLACHPRGAQAQMPHPFRGSVGVEAPPGANGQVLVLLDVVIGYMDQLHSARNAYSSVMWVHASWRDPRAAASIQARSEATLNPSQPGSSDCNRHCDASQDLYGGCCDTVWLPFIDFPNLSGIAQEAVYNERIWVEPSSTNPSEPGDWVHWSSKITGEWRSPFDFRAWPFEHQHLLIEMQLPPSLATRAVLLLNSVSTLQNTAHSKGELLPGWHQTSITSRVFDMTNCYRRPGVDVAPTSVYDINNATAGQPVAFRPLSINDVQITEPLGQTLVSKVEPDECSQLIPSGSNRNQVLEHLAYYSPRLIVIDIMVKRARDYYLLANILPLIIMTYMVFVIYAMERSDLEARMGVVVALVLAVSALQFTWDFPPSNYLNCVQQLTLMSYVLYLIVAIESMISSYVTRLHKHRRQKREVQAFLQQTAASQPSGSTAVVSGYDPSYGPTGQAPSSRFAPTRVSSTPGDHNLPPIHDDSVYVDLPHPPEDGSVRRRPHSGGGGYDKSGATSAAAKWRPAPIGEAVEGHAESDAERVMSPDGPDSSKANGQNRGKLDSPSPRLAHSGTKARSMWGRMLTSKFMTMTRSGSWKKLTKGEKKKKIVSKDEAMAIWIARRVDIVVCWSLLIAYTVTMIVLLYINSEVGDHRMMMHGTPANM